jgi:glycosyltransferase 2 family protein
MPNVTSAIAREIRKKSGLSWLAAAISVAIVVIAASTLLHVFREIEFGKVASALKAQSSKDLLFSCTFIGAGYLALTCYDVFALRTIGRTDVPYRVAALASFTSYTIGHNFGAAIFTTGVIRYRIYSTLGLNVGEITRIALITALTYWLGTAFVLGLGMALEPGAAGAIDRLPAAINRLIGLFALIAIVGYVLWLLPRPRSIGRSRWWIRLPGPASTVLQIGIGAVELTVVALAMYVLLPAQPPINFFSLMVVFVAAMLIGVISYVPGSLGVMEAAMFIGLPQFRREDLLAALLTFRVLYFLIPLVVAAFLLGLREVRAIAAGVGGSP